MLLPYHVWNERPIAAVIVFIDLLQSGSESV
jgi:hypothetical protein